MPNPSAPSGQLDTSLLEERCRFFLVQGLAQSTQKSYASGQRRFYNFCLQAGKLHPTGSPCPTDEWTLCLFVAFLADSIQHSSIKVYLSAVQSLHIEQGFPDPLLNCLRLRQVMREIKRSQGSSEAHRLPVTDSIMLIIWQSLDVSSHDDCMFWAACTLGYFGFLRSAEFTVPNLASFTPAIHLSVADLAVDSSGLPPACVFKSRLPKLTHFARVPLCILDGERLPCALSLLCWLISPCGAMHLAPCSCSRMGSLCLVLS